MHPAMQSKKVTNTAKTYDEQIIQEFYNTASYQNFLKSKIETQSTYIHTTVNLANYEEQS